ncbi:hypothetical protein [Saccharomonospora cyanea]|uniref:Uncharacterized protein n=1 Tax=Saccharomonospora cyanea NA-134 TaxID=882082 RepID=H5XRJ9_9PSEU|nr:hypothetical protein [Saccharomonospora cyanea]EHR63944.1 hypothetical protein SaccyDRAFT_5150 [Saccharomonospora cyanea NA-134]
MRIGSTTLTRVARRTLAATTAAAVIGGAAVLSAGTASAATVTADSCTSVVGGRVGDVVVVDGAAVSELVRQGAEEARTIVVIHHLTIWPNHLAREMEDEHVEVGTVPDRRTSAIDGEVIGAAVRDALEGKAGLGALPSTQETTLDTIATRVAQACSMTVEATNHTAPSASRPSKEKPSGEAGGSADDSRGDAPGSGTVGGSDDGRRASLPDGGLQTTGDVTAERRDYGGIPVAEAPGAGISVPEDLRYGPASGLPGELTTPRYGVVDGNTGNSTHGAADVRDAGEADALATQDRQQAVQLPMLLAVVALAAVTAGLVRSWVVRRAA